ncbi:MAG TPA: hypothetical protein DCF62_05290 [Porticoccaceae bacterium]|nr:hypothetical protein [Porticoccaceae bacterium]
MNSDPLAQLRDIHLPEAIGWWPPAPGWWLLTLLLIAALGYALWWWRRRRARLYFRGQAHQLLVSCWRDYELNGEDRVFMDALLDVLKRALRSNQHQTTRGAADHEANPVPDSANVNEPLGSMNVFKLLNTSTKGELGKQINVARIEQFLYQPQAAPLSREQCQALYQAARRYLKQVHRQC